MPPRDELLVIIDLTSTIIRAGVGVHDLVRPPIIELSTRIGRYPNASVPYRLTDYVVGKPFEDAELAGEELDVVFPLISGRAGLEVVDWAGVEAIMRYVFHIGLALPRPPLAHPVLLSLPPHLPPVVVDMFHALLFERLLVPQLLVATRPFLAAAACSALSAVVLDIGARGEGSEVSIVHESQVIEGATARLPVDEGVCDDWCSLILLQEDEELPGKLSPSNPLAPGDLRKALRIIIESLKEMDAIGFASPYFKDAPVKPAAVEVMDEGTFDVARVLVEGKVDEIVGKTAKEKSDEDDKAGDFVKVPHPLDSEAEDIRIGPARRRYLEPLFMPHIVAALKPSTSKAAALLDLQEYDQKELLYAGVQEIVGLVVEQVDDVEARRWIWDGVVVVSSGKIGANKALGPTLIPLLSPFVIDPESGSETQPKLVRFAKTPDYFSEFKERGGETACYLGGCIIAKILISDLQSRLFMSKSDYSAKGPAFYRLLEAL